MPHPVSGIGLAPAEIRACEVAMASQSSFRVRVGVLGVDGRRLHNIALAPPKLSIDNHHAERTLAGVGGGATRLPYE